jgi:hypothetical protein
MIWIIIVVWILTNLSILLGIGISVTITNEDNLRSVQRKLKRKTKELGAVNKPSPEELAKRGTIEEATEKEVETLLDKILPEDEKPKEKQNK